MKNKLIHLEKELKLKIKAEKKFNKLKLKFPHKETITLDLLGLNNNQMSFNILLNEWQMTQKYAYYLFKSKNKPILTAKSKHWLKPKYNKK
jgi:hypothetical protein